MTLTFNDSKYFKRPNNPHHSKIFPIPNKILIDSTTSMLIRFYKIVLIHTTFTLVHFITLSL